MNLLTLFETLGLISFYRTQVRSLLCPVTESLALLKFLQIVGFVKVVTWISLTF